MSGARADACERGFNSFQEVYIASAFGDVCLYRIIGVRLIVALCEDDDRSPRACRAHEGQRVAALHSRQRRIENDSVGVCGAQRFERSAYVARTAHDCPFGSRGEPSAQRAAHDTVVDHVDLALTWNVCVVEHLGAGVRARTSGATRLRDLPESRRSALVRTCARHRSERHLAAFPNAGQSPLIIGTVSSCVGPR